MKSQIEIWIDGLYEGFRLVNEKLKEGGYGIEFKPPSKKSLIKKVLK